MRGRIINLGIRSAGTAGWIILLGLILALLQACIPQTGAAEIENPSDRDLHSAVLSNGTLVIATDHDYPPQSQLKGDAPRLEDTRCSLTQYTANQMVGFDVEVAVEVARRLDVEACFVTPAWSQIVGGNWSGRWDVSVGSMAITSGRMERLYFTQPYTTGSAVLFVHQDNQVFKAPGDLSGKRIGVCTGCAYEAYLGHTLQIPGQMMNFQIQDAVVIGYDTDMSALLDLALGDGVNLDAVMTDPDTGQAAILSGLPIVQLGGPIYHDYVSIALDKQSSRDPLPLALAISDIIRAMHQEGTLSELSQKYYAGDFTAPAAAFDIQALEQAP